MKPFSFWFDVLVVVVTVSLSLSQNFPTVSIFFPAGVSPRNVDVMPLMPWKVDDAPRVRLLSSANIVS